MLSDIKVTKTVTVRELKRGTPEGALARARPSLRLEGLVRVRREPLAQPGQAKR
jgi:hypothetical protein